MAHTAIGHFMNQKDFHPSNFHNQKRKWIAEQKAKADAAREKERIAEYQAEAAIHDTKGYALMGKAESDLAVKRHAVNFMYDAPAGMDTKKDDGDKLELDPDRQLRLDEKFSALKGAPREEYAKDLPARDNPFGVQIRNVQCRKCEAWGHQSTDRVCPLFNVARVGADGEAERHDFEDPAVLMRQMADEGLTLKQSALGRMNDTTAENQQIVVEPPEEDHEAAFLASLSSSQKKELHKRLSKLDPEADPTAAADAIAEFAAEISKKKRKKSKHKKDKSSKSKKDKKDKKKKAKKHKHSSHRHRHGDSSDDNDSSSDDNNDSHHRHHPSHARHQSDRHRSRSRSRSPVRHPSPPPSARDAGRDDDRRDGRDASQRAVVGQASGGYRDHPSEGARHQGGQPPRMSLQLSDAAYKLTGRTKPAPAPPTTAQETAVAGRNAPLQCYRCGRDGHSRSRCKEIYHKSGARLMKGHFQ
eukprot:m.62822 g.62822  ORF g.62822 m.62822 type:complete len:471 (+) comp8114_c0_seq2:297-1709(+)